MLFTAQHTMPSLTVDRTNTMDLDSMLKELGQFGRYQLYYYFLLVFPIIFCGYTGLEYVFITMEVPHRCRVPECEGISGPVEFSPPWLSRAVPYADTEEPEQCLRYRPRREGPRPDCPADLFDTNVTVGCDAWVFEESVRTMVQDFELLCPEEEWKLTAVGSVGVLTSFVGLPLAGVFSDRFGRRNTLVVGVVAGAASQLFLSFVNDYDTFLRTQLVLGFVGGFVYGPCFILALEMLSHEKKLLGSMLINIYFCLGEVLLGLAMWWLQDWRHLLRLVSVPMLALVSYFWILPESVRWLYARGKYEEVEKILCSIARINKTTNKLPPVLESLRAQSLNKDLTSLRNVDPPKSNVSYMQVLKSKIIMFRLVACSFCWMAILFTYYGLTLDSISVGGNRYMNFILVSLVEIPASVVSLWAPDIPALGRRWTTAGSFFLSGAACWAFWVIDEEDQLWDNVLVLTGKFCSTLTIAIIYLYTAEIFPTELRTSLLAVCSTAGRLGPLFVPQIPLLADYMNPMILFGAVSFVGGLLILGCPETLNTKLPDTIQEAENIGKLSKNQPT